MPEREKGKDIVARINLWGQQVGAVAEQSDGRIIFEYDAAFARSGLEISPVHLPLSLKGPVTFPELSRIESFAGLPGVLADALPDAFGNAIIRRYFEQHGTPAAAFSPVQKLLYIGSRAMGALEFAPAMESFGKGKDAAAVGEALEVARLVEEARRVIAGDPDVSSDIPAIPAMMQAGASPGGARAKALILWYRAGNRVKSAFAPSEPGDESWMIKFDGVSGGGGGHALQAEFKAGPWCRIEYAYSVMARAAGIEMAATHLLRERKFAHFMTRRFDRVPSGKKEKNGGATTRLHMHSLGGLHHLDYNIRGMYSYESYFRTVRLLGMGQLAVDEAFRRMVFNLAARNQDDHVKNFAFLMQPNGTWQLAPAFDLTYAVGGRWARTHQMTVRGKDDEFTREDLLAVGREFDVRKNGALIIEAVDASLALWPAAATEAGLAKAQIAEIEGTFRRFT
ncbi:MAG: type II toxin-antitoxin system HipA family toxin [Gemmatimonadaceae bacterium]